MVREGRKTLSEVKGDAREYGAMHGQSHASRLCPPRRTSALSLSLSLSLSLARSLARSYPFLIPVEL